MFAVRGMSIGEKQCPIRIGSEVISKVVPP